MKKSLNFCLFFILLLYSCSENYTKKQNDLEKENLKGEVIFIKEIYQFDQNDPILEISEYDKGYIVRKYVDNTSLKIFQYKNGYLEKTYTDIFEEGEIRQDVEMFAYDSNMKLVKKSRRLSGIYEEENFYYSNNKLEKESFSSRNFNSITTYFYSENLDSTFTKYENFLRDSEKVYYNNKGQTFKNVINYGKIELTIINEYNEWGDIIKSISSKTNGGGVKEIDETDYVYDENGNWTSRTVKYNDGRKSKTIREIFYKGDDFTEVSKILDEFASMVLLGKSLPQPEKSNNSNRISSSEKQSQSSNSSQKRICYQCNGSGQCRECSKTFRREYYKGNGSYDNRNETKPGYVMCSDCRGRGHKQVKRDEGGWEPGGDCYVSACMDGWIFCRTCNYNGNGRNIGRCERCKGTGQE